MTEQLRKREENMNATSITTVIRVNDQTGLVDSLSSLMNDARPNPLPELNRSCEDYLKCDQLLIVSTSQNTLSFGDFQLMVEAGIKHGSIVIMQLPQASNIGIYREVMNFATSDFVLFMEQGDTLSDDFLKIVYNQIRTNEIQNLLACSVKYLHRPDLIFPNTNKFKFDSPFKQFNLALQPSKIQMTFKGVIFNTSKFKEVLSSNSKQKLDEVLLLTLLLEKEANYCATNEAIYFVGETKSFEDSLESEQRDREWIDGKLNTVENLLEKEMSSYRKHVIAFLLNEIIQSANYTKDHYGDFPVEEFQTRFMKLIALVDQEIIFSPFINRNYRYWLLQEKGVKCDCLNDRLNGNLLVYSGEEVIMSLKQYQLLVHHIEVRSGCLHVMGHFTNCAQLPVEKMSISLLSQSGKRSNGKVFHYPKGDKACFGKSIYQSFAVEIVAPLVDVEEHEFSFQFRFNNISMEVDVRFLFKSGLYHYDQMYAYHREWLISKVGSSCLKIVPYTKEAILALESKLVTELASQSQADVAEHLHLRKKFIDRIPQHFDKRIWVFLDRGSRADDNAEHLFKYCMQQQDGIEKYYCIDKECPDYSRLKDEFGDRIVAYLSDEFFFLWFSSERIITSHLHLTKAFCEKFKIFNGFFTTRQTMIQHGIILYSLPVLYDQIAHNFAMFTASTIGEYDHILNDSVTFNKDVLKLTGLARFDNLVSAPKKQILVSFTWRQYLVTKKQADWSRKYNASFRETNYYLGMNQLFTDTRLSRYMKEKGYVFAFRPHPNVYQQIADFEESDTLTIIPDEVSYQTLYKESALMISDYSSAVFDFAYLNKPIIYYQYEPVQKEEGYFHFEEDGFGEVVTKHEEMVDLIIQYIDSDCRIKNKFKDRIDRFFNWRDRNNCARIYHEMIESDPHKLLSTSANITPYNLHFSGQLTVNSSIKFSADYYGGSGNCTFAWEIFDECNTRVLLRKYASENQFFWIPSAPGKYRVKVYAKDESGDKSSRYFDEYLNISN